MFDLTQIQRAKTVSRNPKNQNRIFFMSTDGNFWLSFMQKIEIKFLHGFMKSLTNCENSSSNRLQGLVPAFQKPPMMLKVVLKAAL
jgi:hypothetical protein